MGNGRPRACYGPCPPLDTYGEPTGISPQRPAEVWRRGERQIISWHRNNHGKRESGFVRFTLVPVSKMMDKNAHRKFTFQISCWSSGLHRCYSRSERVCGNDAEGLAYEVPMTVPSVYPDGVYVFGWAWYGGGDFRGRGFFGDYYSCSFIRIEGGSRLTTSYSPRFIAGTRQSSQSTCISSVDRIGVCIREPCRGPQIAPRRPRGLPRTIYLRDISRESFASNNFRQNSRGGRKKLNKESQFTPPIKNIGRGPLGVKGFRIFDVATGKYKDVPGRGRKLRVRLSKYRLGFTVGLRVRGHVTKVTFSNRRYFHTEALPPYIINGDSKHRRLTPLPCRRRQTLVYRATLYGSDSTRKDVDFRISCT